MIIFLVVSCLIISAESRPAETGRSPGGNLHMWPYGVVPFTFNQDEFTAEQITKLVLVMSEISSISCVRFVPRNGESDYVKITGAKRGCFAYTGKTGGSQIMNLDNQCFSQKGVIVHTVMHALGFLHEHSRPDRDKYVKIVWENINYGHHSNFQIQSNNGYDLGIPYDYESVMHYDSKAYTKNNKSTIIPINPFGSDIGQRKGLSRSDVRRINKAYECLQSTGGGLASKLN